MSQPKPKLIFLGTPEFSIPSLWKLISNDLKPDLVLTQPDKPAGRHKKMRPSPVKLLAQENNLEISQPPTLKDEQVADIFKKMSPDLGVVVAYGKIIPAAMLEIPKHGFLNLHPSLLPKYRGPSPIQTAILNGDVKSGVTIMLLDKGMDTGPMLSQKSVKLDSGETSETLHDKLSHLGADLLVETISLYLSGKIQPKAQDNNQAVVTKIITKEDGKVNWHQSAQAIDRQIRAYHPWPGAWTTWQGKKIKIVNASPIKKQGNDKLGQVIKQGQKVLVSCGKDCLSIIDLQLEGKKILPSNEFIRGHPNFISSNLST